MSTRSSYLAAAFNARPFGMPIPPNWFGLAAFALLGALLNPGFLLIGAGAELAYLLALTRSRRFRNLVDAQNAAADTQHDEYQRLWLGLDRDDQQLQQQLEKQCGEIARRLAHNGDGIVTQQEGLERLCWLHLKLMGARGALLRVVREGQREHDGLVGQRQQLQQRLARNDIAADLQRSLQQQSEVIASRLQAHTDAQQRLELVDAERERIRQQVALMHEQALLSSDAEGVGRSLDVLTASLNEANHWLREQRELFGGLQDISDAAPPAPWTKSKGRTARKRMKETENE